MILSEGEEVHVDPALLPPLERPAAEAPVLALPIKEMIAIVQEKQGKNKEGMANLEKAVAINPQNTPAKEHLDRLKATSRKTK